jgi:hypothetical protein
MLFSFQFLYFEAYRQAMLYPVLFTFSCFISESNIFISCLVDWEIRPIGSVCSAICLAVKEVANSVSDEFDKFVIYEPGQ